ncbi:hypothetical protein PGB90_001770 [Kerria lacca]
MENNENNCDNYLIVIKDIKPAAKHHYLVIPRKHIVDAKCLTNADKPLVELMIEQGKTLIQEKSNGDLLDSRFLFHWPPFHSVPHLHLHVIFPTREMSFINRILFKPNTWWCVSADYVLQRIST